MNDGLKDEHRQAILEVLRAHPGVGKAVLFGSRAMGTFTAESDVDICLYGKALTLTDQARLASRLEELTVPQRVDLLLHHAIQDQALLDHIRREGEVWFERSSGMAGEWREMSLGEFVHLQRGHDLPAESRRPGTVPVMGSGGQNGLHDTAITKGPGVVIGRSGVGSMGVVSYCALDYWPDNTVLYVTDFCGNDERFAYYFLRQLNLRRFDSGSAQASLNRNYIYPIRVFAPEPREQRAIAHILGTLDDKIELNRRMNETLEAMGRALFKSWFVDFDPARAKAEGRDPGLPKPLADLFPDSFEDSELGEIPSGWEVGTLERVLSELEVGGRPKGGVSSYTEGVPSIGAESIVGLGRFDYSKTKYIPCTFFDAMKKGHVKNRDVLLYKDGGRPGEYEPHVTLVGDGFPFATCAINEHVYRLRAKSTLGQNYLFFWLSSDLVMEEMRIKGTGVAIPGLNSTQVKSLTTLTPSRGVIGAFDDVAERLIARVLCACNESRTLATLRGALLPKLISGELRVKDAENFVGSAL